MKTVTHCSCQWIGDGAWTWRWKCSRRPRCRQQRSTVCSERASPAKGSLSFPAPRSSSGPQLARDRSQESAFSYFTYCSKFSAKLYLKRVANTTDLTLKELTSVFYVHEHADPHSLRCSHPSDPAKNPMNHNERVKQSIIMYNCRFVFKEGTHIRKLIIPDGSLQLCAGTCKYIPDMLYYRGM